MHHLLCHPANSRMRAPAGPGACYLWDDGSTGNPRTVTPLQDARYSVTVLDEQLRPAIRRYKVEVVSIQAELIAALAPGDFCGAGPVTLGVEGALPHYTYLWSTGETTPEFQVPLTGMAPAYRVTITDTRQDGAGNTVACAQVLELRAQEVLAAVEEQQCGLLYSRLEALGFEARQVKILEPVQAIAPRSSASATCNVTDNTNFSVEWYGEPLDPSGILCSEMAEMEGVTQGFIYASDDICTEADLAEVEALINDETLLHVYLKPCGGEEYGYLMQKSPVVQGVSAIDVLKKNDKGVYIYPELADAFLIFAKSPAGYALLAKFGKKGQVISKAYPKEIPPFAEDGEYYQKLKLDIKYTPDDLRFGDDENGKLADGANGTTGFYANGNSGRYILSIRINYYLNENNIFAKKYKLNRSEVNRINYVMSRVRTYFHEMVMHAISDAEDWRDKKMDLSNIPIEYKTKGASRATAQHNFMRSTNSLWNTKYVNTIADIWIKANPKISRLVVIEHLKDYL